MIRRRPTVAVIDLDAIRHNLALLRPPRASVMAVVKANGYGHGAPAVSQAAIEAGATWLGVALVEEGIELREHGITARILVLSEFPPGADKEALVAGLTPSVYSAEAVRRLAKAAAEVGHPVSVHLKADTGRHRVGIEPDRSVALATEVLDSGLDLEGLWTHFAVADEPADPFTSLQLDRLRGLAMTMQGQGIVPRMLHAANSAASMTRTDSHLDLVRLGIAMYGLAPSSELAGPASALRPAMSLRSAVTMVKRVGAREGISYGLRYAPERPSWIATVPVGYADGYSRRLSGQAQVLIRGRRHPVAGTITMDQLMVDCGDERVEPGDEVVLMGRQGDAEVTAGDLAEWSGTIGYEIVCGISERVPRVYAEGG